MSWRTALSMLRIRISITAVAAVLAGPASLVCYWLAYA